MRQKKRSKARRPARRLALSRKIIGGTLILSSLIAAAIFTSRISGEPVEVDTLGDVIDRGAAAGYNVLLVTLDTVRWDYLGCYGREQARTPEIDALTENGVLFEQAIASVPLTLPSHATILTGLNPPSHGAHDNGRYRLDNRNETLAETFKAHGYDTAAFVACFVLDARFGADQGFDVYDFKVDQSGYHPKMPEFNERSADSVTDAALKWLRERREEPARAPFFLWVHYYDAHRPYTSPNQHDPHFAGLPYDAEIAYVDHAFGRLHRELLDTGLADSTLIIVTADHGEALGEHGEPTHGLLLYDSTIRVPLILNCPTLFSSDYQVTGQLAGLVDLRRTLEDLVGLPHDARSDGASLIGRKGEAVRSVYCETEEPLSLHGWSPLRGMRGMSEMYIEGQDPEYYDLETDPGEEHNLYSRRPDGLEDLVSALERIEASADGGDFGKRELSDDEIERFAALGYIRTNRPVDAESLPDPKSMMGTLRDANQSERLYESGRYEEAADLAERVLSESPGSIQARRVLAMSSLKTGDADRAVEVLKDAMNSNPDPFVVRSLAQVLILEEKYEKAKKVLDLYAKIDPKDGRHLLLRGDIKARTGHLEEAITYYERAAEVDPNRTGLMAEEREERTRRTLAGQ